MNANADKYHLLTTINSAISVNTEEFVRNNSNEEKRFGIKIDTKLLLEKPFFISLQKG